MRQIKQPDSQNDELVVVVQVQWDGSTDQTEAPKGGFPGVDILLIPIVN